MNEYVYKGKCFDFKFQILESRQYAISKNYKGMLCQLFVYHKQLVVGFDLFLFSVYDFDFKDIKKEIIEEAIDKKDIDLLLLNKDLDRLADDFLQKEYIKEWIHKYGI